MRYFITFLAKGGIYSDKTPCFKQKKSHYLDKKYAKYHQIGFKGIGFLKTR